MEKEGGPIYADYEKEIDALRAKEAEELDVLVSPSRWCIRLPQDQVIDAFVSETTRLSQEFVDDESLQLRRQEVPYGPTERQRFDVFSRKQFVNNAPVVLFFHGGYWRAMKRQQFYHIGKPLISNGVTFVSIGYDLAPEVSMTEIMRQTSAAVEKIMEMTEGMGCRDVYVAGHSAGGQLALVSVCWSSRLTQLAQHFKGFILLSTVYDLRPLQSSSENEVLRISDAECRKFSPTGAECMDLLKKHLGHSRYLIVVPEHDAPEFWRQGRHFHRALLDQGMRSEFLELKGRDHFDYMEMLHNQNYDLSMKILNFIKESGSS